LSKDLSKRFNTGDALTQSWIENSRKIEETKQVLNVIPNPDQQRKIVEELLLPAVNLKRQIADVLVRLKRYPVTCIKVIICFLRKL